MRSALRRSLAMFMTAVALATVTVLAQPRPAAPGLPGDPYDPAPPEETEAPSDAGLPSTVPPMVSVQPLLEAGALIARGRGVAVTAGELYDRLHDAPPALLQHYATDPAALQGLVDRLVGDRLLVAEAVRRGFDHDPIVRATVERALVARLRATTINPAAGAVSDVTDEEARGWYQSHAERFHIPERRRARVIFVRTRMDALGALRLALVRRRGHVVHEFRALAAERNVLPALRTSSGELHELTPTSTDVDPALRDGVFAVEHEGDVLPRVVPGRWGEEHGFFVVRLVARRAAIERTFAESVDWIRGRIVLERRVAGERAFSEQLARDAALTEVPLERVVRLDAGLPAGDQPHE